MVFFFPRKSKRILHGKAARKTALRRVSPVVLFSLPAQEARLLLTGHHAEDPIPIEQTSHLPPYRLVEQAGKSDSV